VVTGRSALPKKGRSQGIDVIEARIDLFKRQDVVSVKRELQAIRKAGLPVIGTIRSPKEGGRARISDAKRLALYKAILPWVDCIDIELGSRSILKEVIKAVKERKKTLMLSYHDFKRTPSKRAIESKIRQARALKAHIVKIATQARTERDVAQLFKLTHQHRKKNLVTISMGRAGSISRVLFPAAGSLLTYTSEQPFAGQIPSRELVQQLNALYPRYA